MAFVKRALRRFFFSFIGTDIQRLIIELQGGGHPTKTKTFSKEVDYVLLAPHQAKALRTMQKYASKQQVCELFELYEKANNARPVDPTTAIRIAKRDIFQSKDGKEWHR
ncbi:MAG: hypothetical protein IKV03_06475 [Alphaproteobacteria bacterium]|nr:hypothetical protein [Alphaproteobacteria bacterium]